MPSFATLKLPSLWPLRWPTRRPKRVAELTVFKQYHAPRWPQRHQKLCYIMLFFGFLFYGFAFALLSGFFLPALLFPVIVLTCFLVWVLPESDRPAQRLLVALFFAYFIALNIWPDYLAIGLPGLPWITLIRLTGFPLALVLLVCVSVSPTFRARARTILNTAPLIWKLVTAFAVIAFLSILLSSSPVQSFQKFFIAQINWTAIFFASAMVFAIPGNITRFVKLLWITMVIVCIIGVIEARMGNVPWAGHIPWFLKIEDESVARILAGTSRAGTNMYRVHSKFGTSLGLGEFLGIVTPFVLHAIMFGKRLTTRVAAVLTLPLVAYTVYLTDSRLAAIGLFVSILLYLLFWSFHRWQTERESMIAPMLVFSYPAIFAFFFASTFFVGRLRALIWGDGSQDASNDARQAMYQTGIPIVLKNPFGNGIGQGASTLGYTNPGGQLTIDTYYLAVALEFGVLGFIIYYGLLLYAAWVAGKAVLKTRATESIFLGPIIIAIFNFVLSKSVFSNLDNHPLVFALLGMVVAILYREANAANPPIARSVGGGVRPLAIGRRPDSLAVKTR